MTTASEINRAAVVEVESKASDVSVVGKAEATKKAVTNRHDATGQEERCIQQCSRQIPDSFGFGSTGSTGSTTAAATRQVVAKMAVKAALREKQSGSKAAITLNAASIRATGLPVIFFSNKSRQIPTQQNPVPLWPTMPERALRARSAA